MISLHVSKLPFRAGAGQSLDYRNDDVFDIAQSCCDSRECSRSTDGDDLTYANRKNDRFLSRLVRLKKDMEAHITYSPNNR